MNSTELQRAKDQVRAVAGTELVERLEHLDSLRATSHVPRSDRPLRPPDKGTLVDVDIAIAGGGLSLLLAPRLASQGLRVAVFDRARVGTAHREWNASGPELMRLVKGGLCDEQTLNKLVVARYRTGVCRFYGGGTYPVQQVLDHAVDAGALLAHTRKLAASRGVLLHDTHTLIAHSAGPDAIALRFELRSGETRDVVARLLVDARGAASPYASASDLICPTVGGVLCGVEQGDGARQIDPCVGEILVTTENEEQGRQHIWEAFPGREGETTVYLFYYAKAGQGGSLLSLYARFFDTISGYKQGSTNLIRPTFGYIPGWSRLGPPPRSPGPRIALVGDAAGRHSPLTFCGFGAMLRSFLPAANTLAQAVGDHRGVTQACIVDDTPVHALTGALTRLMASEKAPAGALNTLLNAAFSTLYEMGNEPYRALLRDEMNPDQFVAFLRKTAAKHPRVYRDVLHALGPWATSQWALQLAKSVLFH